MSRYRDVFRKRHTLLVVVPAVEPKRVVDDVMIALDNGADGVFLINQAISSRALITCFHAAREVKNNAWIGLNFQGHAPLDAAKMLPETADGLWVDNCEVTSTVLRPKHYEGFRREHKRGWLYFGGVAFKEQEPEPDPAAAAVNAMSFVDVVTTSGPRTGSAPDVAKMRSIREGVGEEFPVANASGTSIQTVPPLLRITDCFLVWSSLCKDGSDTELEPKRVRALRDQMDWAV